jgi:hypothetical protein
MRCVLLAAKAAAIIQSKKFMRAGLWLKEGEQP